MVRPSIPSRKRSSQPVSQEDESPPKRRHLALPRTLAELGEEPLHHLLQFLPLPHLSRLTLASKGLGAQVLAFLQSPLSLAVALPSMVSPAARASPTQYQVEGRAATLGLDPALAPANFRRLGELAKRATCLLPTGERVLVGLGLLGRLSCPLGGSAPLMAALGIFLHTLVRGWADDECAEAAAVIYRLFDLRHEVTELLRPEYLLGSRVEEELLARNFLSAVFHHQVAAGAPAELRLRRRLWLRALVAAVSGAGGSTARLLLLMTSPAREGAVQHGVQWADHEEAIPATLAVASARYGLLVSLLASLRHAPALPTAPLLATMFANWLPENMGAVLLLLGQAATREYLRHAAALPALEPAAAAITGLALMTARCDLADVTLHIKHLDEIVSTHVSKIID